MIGISKLSRGGGRWGNWAWECRDLSVDFGKSGGQGLFRGRRGWLTEFGDVVLFEVASSVFMIPVFFKGLEAVGAVIGATGTLLTFGRN